MALINNLKDTGTGKKKTETTNTKNTQKTSNTVIDFMKQRQMGTTGKINAQSSKTSTNTVTDKLKKLYNVINNSGVDFTTPSVDVENTIKGAELANLTQPIKNFNDNATEIRNNVANALSFVGNMVSIANKTRSDMGMSSPIQEVVQKTTPILQGISKNTTEYLKNKGQERLDSKFSEKADASGVLDRVKADNTYAGKLMDPDGNLIDYSGQIESIKEQLNNPFSSRKNELAAELRELEDIQNDQNRLLYGTYYQQLVDKGATQEELNQFKNYVIADDYNGIQRTLATVGGSLENFVGSLAKFRESQYAAVSNLLGVDYDLNDQNSIVNYVIDNSEQLMQNAAQGASGTERAIQEIYTSQSNYLYATILSMLGMKASPSAMAMDETLNEAVKAKALLYSDMSVFGSTIKRKMDEGYDPMTSAINAAYTMALSDMTEQIGGEVFFDIFSSKAGTELAKNAAAYTAKTILKSFGAEAIEEGTEGFIQPLIDSITLNGRGMTVKEYLDSIDLNDIGHQALMGGIGGGLGAAGGIAGLTINTNRDVNQLMAIRNTYQEIMDSDSFDANDKAYVLTQIRDINQKINEYRKANPYADAFISKEDQDIIETSLQENEEIFNKFAQVDLSEKLKPINELKQQMLERTEEFYQTGREKLAAENIDMDVFEYESLSPEAKVNTSIAAKYAQSLGRQVTFANLTDANGDIVDGVYMDGKTVINPNAKQGALSTLLHEYTHGMESSKYYSGLKKAVKEFMGDDYDSAIEQIKADYSTITALDEDGAERELVAVANQSLLENMQFVERLVKYNNSLATRVYEDIKHLGGYTDTVSKIEYNFMRAFRDAQKDNNTSEKTQYAFTAEKLNGEEVNLEIKSSFADAVDSVLDGTISPTSDHVLVSEKTNDILLQYVDDIEDRPMLIEIGKIKSALGYKSKGNNIHHVSESFLKNISEEMNKPKMIYWNSSEHSVNMLLFDDQKPVVVAIKPDSRGRYYNVEILTNRIATVFDVEGKLEEYLNYSANKIYYPLDGTKKEVIARVVANTATKPAYTSTNSVTEINKNDNKSVSQKSIGTKLKQLLTAGIDLDQKIIPETVGSSKHIFESKERLKSADFAKKGLKDIEDTFGGRKATIKSNGQVVNCNLKSMKHDLGSLNDPEHPDREAISRANAFVIEHAGKVIENAYKINQTKPTEEHRNGQDIYLSIIYDDEGNAYPSRIIVDRYAKDVSELCLYSKLYAINSLKKERLPDLDNDQNPFDINTLRDLGELVKDEYSDALPQYMLDYLGITRKASKLADNIMYSNGTRLENLIGDARKELRVLTDKSRKVNLTETLNQAVSDIRETGDIAEETYNELRDKVIESTYSRMPNDQYGMAQNIREMIGNRFGKLSSSDWDTVLKDINDTYNLYNEDDVSFNSLQDAQEFINEYLEGIGGKYIYANPVEMGYMSQEEYEDMVDSKLNEVVTNLKDGVQASDVAEMLDNGRDIEENMYRQGQENLDSLLQEEDGMIKALEQASIGNLSPEDLDQLEQISLEPISIEEAKEKVSPVLKEAAKSKKPLRTKKDILYQVRQKIFDKGIAIRDMKDRQLSTSYDRLLDAENMANFAISNGMYDKKGKKISDSLTQISKLIPESQKNDFDYYMYHRHNIDAAKYHKDVFMGFDAAKSKQIVNQYEMLHPDWASVADKYYKLNDALLAMQVESGVISQDMANHWKEMYPNYVPTKRVTEKVDDANIVETADPEVVSANKGTLYERTGGDSPIQPLDYAMAEHIKQIYRSSRFNDFAKNYVNASKSKTTTFAEYFNYEDVIQGKEEQLTKADEFTPATMIWYDSGDRKIVELPQNIYDAVSPAETPFNLPSNIPFLSWASKLRTNMITGANPVFWATNAIKDFQDIGFNSKYAKDTYLNLPRAYKELLTNGDIANLYKSQGGEYQTYSSEAGINQNDHGRFYNATIGNFVRLNELIEMAPRLAEFMSSLDHGDSVDTAMYNAAEVTTNFKRGGDYAKWINRNGANFFNASIQGFDKQIRNIEDAYDSKGWKGIVGYMAKSVLLSGVPLVVLNGLLHIGDKDYEELSDYIKDNYYVLWKYDDGKFVRIPKGRIANAWQGLMMSLYENGVELASDDKAMKKAQTVWNNTLDGLKNVWEQVGINDVGGNNIFSPIIQTLKNEAWYGDPIVSTYMQKKDAADQFDESTDIFSVWLGQKTNISPMKINYLLDQYSGGAGDVILPMLTPKAETGFDNGTIGGKVASVVAAPFADKFTTDSVFKNQKVSDFFTLDEELTKLAQKEHASDENILASKYINSIQFKMNELYAKRREIQKDMSLTDAEKYDKARDVQRDIDELARYGLDTYDQLDVESYYGNVNGMSFYKNNDNEWQKVSEDKDLMLNSYGLSTKEKSDYFYTTNTISNIRKDIKDDTPEGEKAEYKTATIDAITGSGLDAKMQNVLYDNYYSGKFTDYVNKMDVSDEDRMAIKVAESKGQSIKDANGKTISNSKALSTADAYADAGVLDDVFTYIKKNGLNPSDFGLSKTVYNYSYNGMAAAYQRIFGEQFGTQDVSQDVMDVINSTYTSSGKKSSGKSTKAQQKQIKALKQALLQFLKATNSSVNMNNVLKNSTKLSDVEKNVKKILQNV